MLLALSVKPTTIKKNFELHISRHVCEAFSLPRPSELPPLPALEVVPRHRSTGPPHLMVSKWGDPKKNFGVPFGDSNPKGLCSFWCLKNSLLRAPSTRTYHPLEVPDTQLLDRVTRRRPLRGLRIHQAEEVSLRMTPILNPS